MSKEVSGGMFSGAWAEVLTLTRAGPAGHTAAELGSALRARICSRTPRGSVFSLSSISVYAGVRNCRRRRRRHSLYGRVHRTMSTSANRILRRYRHTLSWVLVLYQPWGGKLCGSKHRRSTLPRHPEGLRPRRFVQVPTAQDLRGSVIDGSAFHSGFQTPF